MCRRHGVWFHIDAAYGGPAVLTARYRDELSVLKDADSLALDPHKWLYVPVEAGLSLVRDGVAMRDAFCLRACVINHRCTEQDIDFLVTHVKQTAEKLLSG